MSCATSLRPSMFIDRLQPVSYARMHMQRCTTGGTSSGTSSNSNSSPPSSNSERRDMSISSSDSRAPHNPYKYVAIATQYMYAGVDRVPTLAYVFKRPVAAKRLANSGAIRKTNLSCRVQRDSYLRFVRLPKVSHGRCDWSASEI